MVREHKRKDIVVVGFDYSEDIVALIDDEGYTASTLLQKQYYMSYTGIQTALGIIEGESVPAKFVDMGVTVVNSDTIGQKEVQEVILHN